MTSPLLVFALLVLSTGGVLGKDVTFSDGLTHDDLVQANVPCAYSESCEEDSAEDRSCACDSECPVFGTCCIDSPHRDGSVPAAPCRNVAMSFSQYGYLLVSRCPPGANQSAWRDLCEGEWSGEDDMTRLAPVTSLDTFASYKNYYCFRCHERGRKFLSWALRVQGNGVDRDRVSGDDLSVAYDGKRGAWIARTGDRHVLEDIHWAFQAPGDLPAKAEGCKYVLVSDCADAWTDEETRYKCRAYTAVVYSKTNESVSFKNPHCALCNFLPASDVYCGRDVTALGFAPKKHFSFAHLLNIHRSDTDGSDTCGENQLWDPYGKKCRRIACAIPGYVVKEGRCTPP